MAHIQSDRVKDTTTTTGTGDITLANSAPTGFRTLDSVAATGDTFIYEINGGAEWEVGLGTYSGSHVFARTELIASSTGSAISFAAGTKTFFITYSAGQRHHRRGNADVAAPLAQVINTQSVVAGTSNTAGVDLVENYSLSTGTGVAGYASLRTGFAGKGAASTTVTMTIAAPCVVTWTAHGFVTGQQVVFTNSGGALPTGITSGTTYYVIQIIDSANTFNVATSLANAIAGTKVTTTGSQSGTHTGTTVATTQNGALPTIVIGPSGITGTQGTAALTVKQNINNTNVTNCVAAIDFVDSTGSYDVTAKAFQVLRNGTSVFSIQLRGTAWNPNGWGAGSTVVTPAFAMNYNGLFMGTGSTSGNFMNIGSGVSTGAMDIGLWRDASGVTAFRYATAQSIRIYRTYTDGSNYERQTLQSAAGYFEWVAETAGTGTDDIDLRLTPAGAGTVRVAAPLKLVPVAVGSLPSAATAGAGARMMVNDALTPTFGATVANGGAVVTPVYSDGTNWKVG